MFCKLCGKYNPDTEKQCKYCGGPLSKEKDKAFNPNTKQDYPMGSYGREFAIEKVCARCGRQNKSSNRVCQYCGGPLKTSKKPIKHSIFKDEVYYEDKSTSGFWLGLLLGIIGLVIGIMFNVGTPGAVRTFLRGWIKGIITAILVTVVLYFCIVGCATCAILGAIK